MVLELAPRFVVEIPGQPNSKCRPRFTRNGRVYSDPKQVAHEEMIGWTLRAAGVKPFSGNVAVQATFYRSNKQRIDVDNLMKAVLDAATGVAWADDCQVTRIEATLELDKLNPRTVVKFYEHKSTMRRGGEAYETSVCPMETRKKISDAAKARAKPPNVCRDCAKPLARRGAVLCRECWLKSPDKRNKAMILGEEPSDRSA